MSVSGVRVIRLDDDDRVVSVARAEAAEDEDDDAADEATDEGGTDLPSGDSAQ